MDATELSPVMILPRRWWNQYRLRVLLMFLVLSSIPCSWLAARVHQARNQQQAVDEILKYEDCQVYYERHGSVVIEKSAVVTLEDPITHHQDSHWIDSRTDCDVHGCPWGLNTGDPKTWAETLFGKSFVRCAITVEVPLNHVEEITQHLKRLPCLRTVLVLRRALTMTTTKKWPMPPNGLKRRCRA